MQKLSQLQRFILLETYRRQYISNPDILIKWFGFKQTRHSAFKFSPGVVGVKKYKSASVSVTRSLTRLRNRGLIRRFSSPTWGHGLTDHGREIVGKWLDITHHKKGNND